LLLREEGSERLYCSFCSYAGKPNFPQMLEENGGDDETRTRDLCRDRVAWLGFTTTYKTAGAAKLRGVAQDISCCGLGCGLVRSAQAQEQRHLGFPEPRFWMVSGLPTVAPESCWARTARAKFKRARKWMACSRGLIDSATLGSFGQRQLWEVTKSVFQPSKILIVRKRKDDL